MVTIAARAQTGVTDDGTRHRTSAATTDDIGMLSNVEQDDAADRPEARRLMHQVQIDPASESRLRMGGPELVSVRWDGRGGDIDTDRLIGPALVGRQVRDDQIYVRRRMRRSRSIMLLIDVSGSMSGERIRTAAAAIGTLFGGPSNDAVGVTAFWSDAAVLVQPGDRHHPDEVLELVLAIRARGLTNIGFGLGAAADELGRRPAEDARIILLSDCVHNAGPDPRPLVVGGPRVDVLLDDSEEHDERVGRDLARATGGHFRKVATSAQVPATLAELFRD